MEANTRFKDGAWYKALPTDPILVIGLGGIGSNFTYLAARIGYPMFLQDMDTVEIQNLGAQFYRTRDMGNKKTHAMQSILSDFTDMYYRSSNQRYDENSFLLPITVVAVDNMATRRIAFNNWKKQKNRSLLLEARLEGEWFKLYTVKKGDEEWYEKTLVNDADLKDAPCTFSQTPHVAMSLAAEMVTSLNAHIANTHEGFELYQYPKLFERNFQLNIIHHAQ